MACEMTITYKNPFDRFLITRALAEDMIQVSNEALFDTFAVNRLWQRTIAPPGTQLDFPPRGNYLRIGAKLWMG